MLGAGRVALGAVLVATGVVEPWAQQAEAQTLDRIVAVVGIRPILFSEVEERLLLLRAEGMQLPQDSTELAAVRRQVVEQMVSEELLVQAAERDTSIKVTDTQVQAAVDRLSRQIRDQFSSELEFQRQLRQTNFLTVEEWRRWLAEQQRRQLLRDGYLEKLTRDGKLRPIPPTDDELRAAFEQVRGTMAARPPTVSFRQIVVRGMPDSVSLLAAWRTADSLRAAIAAGADFATVARSFSEDSASLARGGELGWFRRGQMVREFEDAAFNLRPGVVSPPVKTSYGFHLIQVTRREPAEIQARHILIRPKVGEPQLAEARARADSVAAALTAGQPFDSLARRFDDPEEDRLVETYPIDSLPRAYQEALAGVAVGQVAPVFQIQSGGAVKFVVSQVQARGEGGEWTLDQVRDRLVQNLGQRAAERRLLDQLRRRTYVDIRL